MPLTTTREARRQQAPLPAGDARGEVSGQVAPATQEVVGPAAGVGAQALVELGLERADLGRGLGVLGVELALARSALAFA